MEQTKIEKKAEEYAKGKAHEHYNFLFEESSGSPIDFAKLCYLDGLADGRKETNEKISALEKENAELKAQNEKMKNVGNCKYTMQCSEWVEHHIKADNIKCCLKCDKWELPDD